MNVNNVSSVFNVKYKPLFAGTDKSSITFFNTSPELSFLLDSDRKKLFVTDTTIFELTSLKDFFSKFSKIKTASAGQTEFSVFTCKNHALIVIPAGEAYKTIDSVLAIVQTALDFSLNRKDIFTAIGGGVITDITAFASSIFKRGASCEFVLFAKINFIGYW